MKKIVFFFSLFLLVFFLSACSAPGVQAPVPDASTTPVLLSSDSSFAMIPEVIDGDTVKLADDTRVRLIGINAPEKGECYYEEARAELKRLVDNQSVRLDKDVSDRDFYDRLLRHLVISSTGKDNIIVGDHMVRHGFAFDISSPPDVRYRDLYSSAEEGAKRERRGLWSACDYPEATDLRETDSQPEHPDCIIKGNISEKGYGKTYLIPGCDNYQSVKVDTKKGEQYFCTEAEAQKAGYRKATNCP